EFLMDYKEYRELQTKYNKKKIRDVWVQESTIQTIKEFTGDRQKILCHGTRNAAEQRFFLKHFPDAEVLGTEISDTAGQFQNTIEWDYHKIKEEWVGKWDIVYSNSLDHSHSPEKAIRSWLRSINDNGYVIIEWCGDNERKTGPDIFAASLDELKKLIEHRNTGGQIVHQINLKPKKEKYRYQALLFIKKYKHPELSEVEMENKTKYLIEVVNILNSQAEYFLGGSALLGLVREGQIVRHGTGVTFHFTVEEYRRVAANLIIALERAGFELYDQKSGGNNAKFKARKGGYVYEFAAWYPGEGAENRYRIRKSYKLPAEIFKPGLSLNIEGVPVKAFNPPEEYCFFRFGSNWRTPINSIMREEYEEKRYHRNSGRKRK
ncbi:MAG: hypothetical protein MIO92_16900, partial [Methanosarcinaceae archaeon]|nr:hypothetical protein [Methanosarcinaceae archaeon]